MIRNNPFARPALSGFALKLSGEVAGFGTLAVLASRGDLEALGNYTMTLAWGILLGGLSVRGDGATLACFVPIDRAKGDFRAVGAILRWSITRTVAFALGLSIAAVFVAETSVITVEHPAFLAVSIPLWATLILGRDIFRTLGSGWWGDLALFVVVPAGSLVLAATSSETPILIGLPLLAGAIVSCLQVRVAAAKTSGTIRVAPHEMALAWHDVSRALALNVLARQILQRLDVLVVGLVLGLESAAIYGVLARLAGLPLAFADPLQAILRRDLRLACEKGQGPVLSALKAAASVLIPSLGLGALVLAVTADPLLRRMGIVTNGATEVFYTLLAARTLGGFGILAKTFLMVAGGHRGLARANVLVSIAVFPPLVFPMTYCLGHQGAATSVLIAWSSATLAAIALARSRFRQTVKF